MYTVYDTSTNTWSEVGEWPEATSDAQAVVLYNEQLSDYYIYVVGGYHQNYSTSNSTWLYAHVSKRMRVKPYLYSCTSVVCALS
jgi:hypothetical protein